MYHLAAIHEVPFSDDQFQIVFTTNVHSTYFLLSALYEYIPSARLFYASSCSVFGAYRESPQNELTPFAPRSLYGVSKVTATHLVRAFREKFGFFGSVGILYNHESPRRDPFFITKKVTVGAARIKLGLETELVLGNLDAQRDWGFVGDFVRAMWLMLQHDKPDDYIIGTGETHSVRDLLTVAFGALGLVWETYVRIDPALLRPADPIALVANPKKARDVLGWKPTLSFQELITLMAQHDLEHLRGQTQDLH